MWGSRGSEEGEEVALGGGVEGRIVAGGVGVAGHQGEEGGDDLGVEVGARKGADVVQNAPLGPGR